MRRSMLRTLCLALALLGLAAAMDLKVKSVVDEKSANEIGKLWYDGEVTEARPGVVLISYDGQVYDSHGKENEFVVETAKQMIEELDVRVLAIKVFKMIDDSSTTTQDMKELSIEQLALAATKGYAYLKDCAICKTLVNPEKIALVGFGRGGNAVQALLSQNIVPFQAGIVSTPYLDDQFAVLDGNTKYAPNMLYILGYDCIDKLDDLEKKNLEQKVGMLKFEIFMQYKTKIHFNVDTNSNFRADQTVRAQQTCMSFLETSFKGEYKGSEEPQPLAGTLIQDDFKYMAGGTEVPGVIIRDQSKPSPLPGMLVVPPWNGFDNYPYKRLKFLARLGYAAMSANIYGLPIGTPVSTPSNVTQIAPYYSQYVDSGNDIKMANEKGAKFAERIMGAAEYLKNKDFVDKDHISGTGFCFGGTGMYNTFRFAKNLMVHASIHGNMRATRDFSTVILSHSISKTFKGYLAMYSGTQDPSESGDVLKEHLAQLSKYEGQWELSRYSGAQHGYSEWGSTNYNANADGRTFASLAKVLQVRQNIVSSAHTLASSIAISLLSAAVTMLLIR